MTEKEIKRIATGGLKKAIISKFDIGYHPSDEYAINYQINKLKAWWKSNFNAKSAVLIINKERREMTLSSFLEEYMPLIERTAPEIILEAQKESTIKKIFLTGVKAKLDEELSGQCLMYAIYEQAFRIKIYIYFDKGNKMVIPIKYKTLQQDIDKVLPTVLEAKKMIEIFGRDFRIC